MLYMLYISIYVIYKFIWCYIYIVLMTLENLTWKKKKKTVLLK